MDEYVIGNFLGRGIDGYVYSCWNSKNNNKYAIKQYLYDPEFYIPASIVREISALRNCNKYSNEFIIKFYSIIFTDTHINIILEIFDDTLYYHQYNNIYEKKILINQLIRSIQFLHSMNYIHGDLSLNNIMTFHNNIKLIDFSFSTKIYRNNNVYMPTFYICPPELIFKNLMPNACLNVYKFYNT